MYIHIYFSFIISLPLVAHAPTPGFSCEIGTCDGLCY